MQPSCRPPRESDIGPVDPSLPPVSSRGDRPGTLTLMARGWWPPVEQITQSYGLCFTADQHVILIAQGHAGWSLPGGSVEPGENPYNTLVREVAEEACARVTDAEYLASQHVADPANPEALTSYFQSRWWARVELEEWVPEFETTGRRLVLPEEMTKEISWPDTTILARLIHFAIDADNRHR
jgi:8-oxo-dGTP pyrophosphatase MutT (NUDIX family)